MAEPAELSRLLERSALQDQRAFAELYRLTSAKLFGVALRILRRRDWAEEVLQESFINIWNHAQDYSTARAAPMTWMTAIVRNRGLDWLRRPHPEQHREDYDLMVDSLPDPAPGPEASLTQGREALALGACLRRLTGSQRQTIVLAYVHGLSHGELAEHLREPLGTVKTWIRRGLERLRVCLEAQARG